MEIFETTVSVNYEEIFLVYPTQGFDVRAANEISQRKFYSYDAAQTAGLELLAKYPVLRSFKIEKLFQIVENPVEPE